MLVGYNTNISYKDNIYHIQTEDSGKNNPVIVTLLYAKGAILASKKTSYAQILQDPELQEKVRKIMKAQHKGMIKDLLAGKYTGDLKDEEEAKAKAETQKEIEKEATLKGEAEVNIGRENTAAATTEESKQREKQKIPEESIQQQEAKEAKAQISKSLDDILLNYIMKRGK